MKKLRSKKRTVKSKKRLFSFISSFYFISILARLSLLLLMAFIISKIFLSTLFPPKNEAYALDCCEAISTIYTIPAVFHGGYSNFSCTNEIATQYTLPFTIGAGLGSTTYYQLPANVSYYTLGIGPCY